MKKQLLTLSLLSALLFPTIALADGPRGNIPRADFGPEDLIPNGTLGSVPEAHFEPYVEITANFAAGDQLHLCVDGNADMRIIKEGGQRTTLSEAGVALLQANTSFYLKKSVEEASNISFYNDPFQAFVTNGNTENSLGKVIVKSFIKNPANGFIPYMDYIPAGNTRKACQTSRLKDLTYNINFPSDTQLNVLVTQINAIENENNEQAPPAAPPGFDGGVAGGEAPAQVNSGGCSMSTAIPGMNYGFSILFSLILGAHALLRFRKK